MARSGNENENYSKRKEPLRGIEKPLQSEAAKRGNIFELHNSWIVGIIGRRPQVPGG